MSTPTVARPTDKTAPPTGVANALAQAEAAEEAAAKAMAQLEAARAAADAAKEAAEAHRRQRMEAFLAKLEAEYPETRGAAVKRQGEARAALESAVRAGNGDIFAVYAAWVQASIQTWAVDAELSQVRYWLGRPGREPRMPAFAFAVDIGGIIDHHALTLVGEQEEAIKARRQAFLDAPTEQAP